MATKVRTKDSATGDKRTVTRKKRTFIILSRLKQYAWRSSRPSTGVFFFFFFAFVRISSPRDVFFPTRSTVRLIVRRHFVDKLFFFFFLICDCIITAAAGGNTPRTNHNRLSLRRCDRTPLRRIIIKRQALYHCRRARRKPRK